MEEDGSSRLNVLDFIIAVLRQHERSLDESLARLNIILRQAERGESRTSTEKASKRPSRSPLSEIERVILNLTLKGESPEEIADRLDTSPVHVRETIEGLTSKGYLPHSRPRERRVEKEGGAAGFARRERPSRPSQPSDSNRFGGLGPDRGPRPTG